MLYLDRQKTVLLKEFVSYCFSSIGKNRSSSPTASVEKQAELCFLSISAIVKFLTLNDEIYLDIRRKLNGSPGTDYQWTRTFYANRACVLQSGARADFNAAFDFFHFIGRRLDFNIFVAKLKKYFSLFR